jgi:AhpD family alkylhydroperoxidase
MARIEPRQPRGIDPIRRLSYRWAKKLYGSTLEPTTIVAHHKPLLLGYGTVALMADRFSHSVDERLKHLAMLRTSQLIGCEWCMDFGSKLAQDSGIDADTLRDLSRWRESERFDELERSVLEYAEGMTRTPVDVSDELSARLREHLDERQMVELTMAVGLENLYSRTNWAFGIESEGFTDGMYCVRPDAIAQKPLAAVSAAR